MPERGDDEALLGVAGDDRGAPGASLKHPLAGIEPQTAALVVGVARETTALEDGAHPVDEEARAGREALVGEGEDCPLRACRALRHSRPGRIHANPLDEPLDLLRRERILVARHLLPLDLVTHRLDEQAPVGIPGDDRGTGIASAHHRLARVEAQIAAAQPSVAVHAAFGQHRPHAVLEELFGGLRGGGPGGRQRTQQGKQQRAEETGNAEADVWPHRADSVDS